MSYLTDLCYRYGGESLSADRPRNNTASDGDYLEARYDLDRLARENSPADIAAGPASIWRYVPLLPLDRPEEAATLGEGFTPMLPAPALSRALDCARLLVKDEGQNPTGSFKDRGASVALSKARELGIRTVVHNSSGNAAAALGLYAARAGIECVNLVPDDVLPQSLQQSILSGARTICFDGPWHESGPVVRDAVARHDWFHIGTLREPYRLEGKKTMGLEIAEQLGWRLPGAIFYPTGGALGAIAIYKAFEELRELGWIGSEPLPRLFCVQYEGCAPIVRAFLDGSPRAETWTDIRILPGGLKSATPPGDRAVLELIRETGGAALAVSTEAALYALGELARLEGIFTAPEGATTIAGLRLALAEGLVDPAAEIVLMSTATGLKSIPNLRAVTPERETSLTA